MAFALVIRKTLVEIAAYALLGLFVVAAFAWQRGAGNPAYQPLRFVTSPVACLVRLGCTPAALALDARIAAQA